MPAPGPASLGRAVIVEPGGAAPSAWASADRVLIDDAVLADPAAAVGRLHDAWSQRRPLVIELVVDPARFREPEAFLAPPWQLDRRLRGMDRPAALPASGPTATTPGATASRSGGGLARPPASAPPRAGHADVLLPDGDARVDRRWPAIAARGAARGCCRRAQRHGGARSARTAAGAGGAHGGAGARPAGGRRPRFGPGADHRPGGVRQDPRAHRALPPPARRPRLRAGGRRRARRTTRRRRRRWPRASPGLGARIQTLNAWGYGILSRALGRRPELLDEREVRSIVERLVPEQAAAGEHRSRSRPTSTASR